MEASGQLHTSAALLLEKDPLVYVFLLGIEPQSLQVTILTELAWLFLVSSYKIHTLFTEALNQDKRYLYTGSLTNPLLFIRVWYRQKEITRKT
jgi:hypothetical protein